MQEQVLAQSQSAVTAEINRTDAAEFSHAARMYLLANTGKAFSAICLGALWRYGLMVSDSHRRRDECQMAFLKRLWSWSVNSERTLLRISPPFCSIIRQLVQDDDQ